MAIQIDTLVEKCDLSPDTCNFRFELTSGYFIGLEPGAHIDVKLDKTLVRQYSIWDWDKSGAWLSVAVKREDSGRGGSLAMHKLEIGAQIEIGEPRNHFKLRDGANHKTLIAGGIGVTPILAMARQLRDQDADFHVFYIVRSKKYAAMNAEFESLLIEDRYTLHCNDIDGRFDLHALMQSVPTGGDIYTCGPEPMLNAVLDAGFALHGGSIHFERFAVNAEIEYALTGAFEIEIESTGAVYKISLEETILSVLQQNGINVDFGCSEGLCGACIVDVVSGDVDHRDGVLSPKERDANEFMCVCVSRARSKRLVLKL